MISCVSSELKVLFVVFCFIYFIISVSYFCCHVYCVSRLILKGFLDLHSSLFLFATNVPNDLLPPCVVSVPPFVYPRLLRFHCVSSVKPFHALDTLRTIRLESFAFSVNTVCCHFSILTIY